ncbi:MAG: hypothetical protein L3J56_11280, partial [Bacteroidales bacterium]|nr:hypothetical protein [Bacteroidales bacterium]
NPAIIESIYETYVALSKRQELIRPILPLSIKNENRNAVFNFVDYALDINNAKNSLSDFLYTNATNLLNGNKLDARKAYDDLAYLNEINPNFKDVDVLLEDAHYKGTTFVLVGLENQTNQALPSRLEDDLLNFNTYGLDHSWTVFHNQKEDKTDYTYQLKMLFHRIDVSPEILNEKQYLLEKEVRDGFE